MELVKIKPLCIKSAKITGHAPARYPFTCSPKTFNILFCPQKKYHYLVLFENKAYYSYHLNGLLETFGEKEFSHLDIKMATIDDAPRIEIISKFGKYEINEFEEIEDLNFLA